MTKHRKECICTDCMEARDPVCSLTAEVARLRARAESAERDRDEARAEVERLRRLNTADAMRDQRTTDRATAAEASLAQARAERDAAHAAATSLLTCIEILADRATEVGWIDKDQHVEAEIHRARRALASALGRGDGGGTT